MQRHDAGWIVQCRRAAGAGAAKCVDATAGSISSFWNFKGEIMTQEHVMLSDVWLWCWGGGCVCTVLGLSFVFKRLSGVGCFVCSLSFERNTLLCERVPDKVNIIF